MTKKNCDKLARAGDKTIACITAFIVAAKRVREDILDVNQMGEPLHFFKRYQKYFLTHKNAENGRKLQKRVCGEPKEEYNPLPEIITKGLEDVLCGLADNIVLSIIYFEATEHQTATPKRCEFGDYMIDFAPSGTTWCGGSQGNGYVFKRDKLRNYNQIAIISSELSNYLADLADQRAKLQKQEFTKTRSR